MKLLYKFLFEVIPPNLQNKLGKSSLLKPLRDAILRPSGSFAVSAVEIEKKYFNYDINFKYFASAKIALKAKKRGVENTLLKNTIELLRKYKSIKDDCVVIDVGTNFGFLSMVWALSSCKNGFVHGFEANKKVYNTFRSTIEHNRINNIVLNYNAVGKKNEEVKIYDMDTTSNVNNQNISNQFNMVDMISLDYYIKEKEIKRCDLVKIDVDGIEFEIINGGLDLLKNLKPIFVIETNNDRRIVDFFKKNDYSVLDMELNLFSDSNVLPPNIFCVPKTL